MQYDLSARDNIALGRHERASDTAGIVRAAEQAGADADISALPEGYETLLGPAFIDGTDLSTGQWQRVALARAFFRDAPVVILDEPTAALAAKAEHELFTRIRELFAGRSVLLISHRFSTVRSADRITARRFPAARNADDQRSAPASRLILPDAYLKSRQPSSHQVASDQVSRTEERYWRAGLIIRRS